MSRVVVKIGTSSLTNEAGVIDRSIIERVANEISRLRVDGHVVTLLVAYLGLIIFVLFPANTRELYHGV